MNKSFRKIPLLATLGIAAGLILVGCAAPAPNGEVSAGRQLFIGKGCAACHGQNAEGTDIAPGLMGHNEQEVKRQVRNPLVNMPRSSPEQISDDELEKIADYIGSLRPAATHNEPVAMEDALIVHHWMALTALESDNPDEAEHHVRHVIEIGVDPEHESQMEAVLEDVLAGKDHDASHAIEEMLVMKAEPELPTGEMHLQLSLASIASAGLEDAKHHLEHFISLATADDKIRAEEAIELLEQGNAHDARHEVEELLEHGAHND